MCIRDRYCLPANLLEIEITESAYAEEYQKITGVAEQLRGAGFTVLMDDFGSGYSSLNMLKDINVDILKIDMKFLDMDEKSADKGLGILEAIIPVSYTHLEVLNWVAEGSAEAGIVYATDAATTDKVKVVAEAPEGSIAEKAIYPVGVVSASAQKEAAEKFVDFLQSDKAIAVFEKYGFIQNK